MQAIISSFRTFLNKYFKSNYIFIALSVIALIFTLVNAPLLHPDSESYIYQGITRSLGYPLFIKIHKILFGSYYLKLVQLSQVVIFILSVYCFKNTLSKYLKITDFSIATLLIILFIPVFYVHKTTISILSESNSYSLYLLCMSLIVSYIFTTKGKILIYLYLALFLLISTRSQFLFLLPVLVFLPFFLFNKKKSILLATFPFVLFVALIFSDKYYHYVTNNYFTSTPWTGIQIATIPFYISEAKDSVAFSNKNERQYFLFVNQKLNEKKLLKKNIVDGSDPLEFYYTNYVKISNGTINYNGEYFFDSKYTNDKKTILNDKMTTKVAAILAMHNSGNYLKLYIQNIIKGANSAYFVLLNLILFVFFCYQYHKESNKVFLIYILFIILVFSNLFLVSVAESIISRYTFYNAWIIFLLLFYLIENYNYQKTEK